MMKVSLQSQLMQINKNHNDTVNANHNNDIAFTPMRTAMVINSGYNRCWSQCETENIQRTPPPEKFSIFLESFKLEGLSRQEYS